MIEKLGCTHYVDDLPEILSMLPSNIKKILYDAGDMRKSYAGERINNWKLLKQIITDNG